MRPSNFLSTLLLVTSATAWSIQWNPFDIAKRELAPLLPRQNDNNNNNNNNDNNNNDNNNNDNQASSSSAPAVSSSAAPDNGNGNGNNNNNNNNGGNNNNNNQKTTSKYQTTKTYDDRLPAGGVSMITPAAILGPQYYKIGNDHVTEIVSFAFNFTSLSATPTAIDIVASCAVNSQTYPIALNHSVAGKTQSVIWDTGKYQKTASLPLPIATYTLMIYDSDKSPTDMPVAGYLGLFNQFTFGLYEPKAPTPISEFVCVTCSGASALERQTIGFLFGMVIVTVLSFGWFTGVAGIW